MAQQLNISNISNLFTFLNNSINAFDKRKYIIHLPKQNYEHKKHGKCRSGQVNGNDIVFKIGKYAEKWHKC